MIAIPENSRILICVKIWQWLLFATRFLDHCAVMLEPSFFYVIHWCKVVNSMLNNIRLLIFIEMEHWYLILITFLQLCTTVQRHQMGAQSCSRSPFFISTPNKVIFKYAQKITLLLGERSLKYPFSVCHILQMFVIL